MALAAYAKSKHRPFVSGGVIRGVIGSTVVKTNFHKDRPIRAVEVTILASASTDADKASAQTWVDNGDGTVTIYLWKATAAGTTTLVAATAAVDLMVRIEVD